MAIKKIKDKWCVVHCHKGKDKIIACHSSYEKALKQHRAIMVSKGKKKNVRS